MNKKNIINAIPEYDIALFSLAGLWKDINRCWIKTSSVGPYFIHLQILTAIFAAYSDNYSFWQSRTNLMYFGCWNLWRARNDFCVELLTLTVQFCQYHSGALSNYLVICC